MSSPEILQLQEDLAAARGDAQLWAHLFSFEHAQFEELIKEAARSRVCLLEISLEHEYRSLDGYCGCGVRHCETAAIIERNSRHEE